MELVYRNYRRKRNRGKYQEKWSKSHTTGVFHTASCDTVRLCGISSRFQLLSPCTRQVAHALLTRPPLSHFINHPKDQSKVLRSTCMC